jgi:subtilisin family serine protease
MAQRRRRTTRRKPAPSPETVWVDPDSKEKVPEPLDADGRLSVLVELRSGPGAAPVFGAGGIRDESAGGFTLDEEFQPVPLGGGAGMAGFGGEPTYVVRATVEDEGALQAIRQRSEVVEAWRDTPIAPLQCPIPPCDCAPGTPKGTIADVATYLGVSQVWSAGYRGAGVVVGVVDGGITAQGRPVKPGQTSRRIPRVIAGWPVADWGTEAAAWGDHGNMCATDVLGMAPDAQLCDLRIAGAATIPATISRALQAFQWAIDRHVVNGTPQILTNSWGIFQETWDTTYARNPNHPFTRKVVDALNQGIIVLFAAGNCGGTCPDGRCGPDNGPGRSIWGANSHPRVMTVGAVNKNEEFVGYSSQGPGALDPNKPDFCSVTHFTGYFTSDSGTSAATPILAGAVAVLKQAFPAATQDNLKGALKATAKDIGPTGFDQHSGSGIVRIKTAYDRLRFPKVPSRITLCRPSVVIPCPSEFVRCIPPTSPIRCRPSIVIRCPTQLCPSQVTLCEPLPTRTPGCVPLPTRFCPTAICRPPGPGPGPEGGSEQEWSGYEGQAGGQDPASAWYGYGEGEEEAWDPSQESWYGWSEQ